MLSTLRIKNLALVSDLTLLLEAGYSAITGETGAGKSIIIGALDLLLGERADRTLIRAGCDSCSVEAVFELGRGGGAVKRLLEDNGLDPCAEQQLILKRVFTAAGANRQFVNGSPTTLQVLAAIGRELVDMATGHFGRLRRTRATARKIRRPGDGRARLGSAKGRVDRR
jgi:DNA repair protein RecN (Recombination protein N)